MWQPTDPKAYRPPETGAELKAYRRSRELSIEALAAQLRVTPGRLSMLEQRGSLPAVVVAALRRVQATPIEIGPEVWTLRRLLRFLGLARKVHT